MSKCESVLMLVDMESTVSVLENKCDFVYSVYVASNFSYQCIIGLDILCDFSCNVDLGNNCIVFNNEESINFECLEDMQFSERDNLQYDSMNGIDIEESINDNTNTFNIDEGLDNSDQEKLEILLQKYKSIFAFSDNQLGNTTLMEHSIDIGDSKPIYQRPFRIPLSARSETSKWSSQKFSFVEDSFQHKSIKLWTICDTVTVKCFIDM
ncbi:unnamed protein product [Mytilus edulis]|uniref:Peptidase A9 domain-containing protein n=1 Tax=Mytilus edulis TaxID=6550 RepID=A0A8S3PPX9_MYTED|nr:unnamed protein product [Mytilus edulis]